MNRRNDRMHAEVGPVEWPQVVREKVVLTPELLADLREQSQYAAPHVAGSVLAALLDALSHATDD